jgi:uncharacterized protein (TIGR01732 family)
MYFQLVIETFPFLREFHSLDKRRWTEIDLLPLQVYQSKKMCYPLEKGLLARAIKHLQKDKYVILKSREMIQMTAFALVVVLFVLLIIVGCSCTGSY